MIRRATIRVSGIVQGVYYRYNTKEKADDLGLSGFVRNLPDGSVEAQAEGEEEEVRNLIEWCGKGPIGARVDRVDVEWGEPSGGLTGFSIRY
jgi:acylphosphatase